MLTTIKLPIFMVSEDNLFVREQIEHLLKNTPLSLEKYRASNSASDDIENSPKDNGADEEKINLVLAVKSHDLPNGHWKETAREQRMTRFLEQIKQGIEAACNCEEIKKLKEITLQFKSSMHLNDITTPTISFTLTGSPKAVPVVLSHDGSGNHEIDKTSLPINGLNVTTSRVRIDNARPNEPSSIVYIDHYVCNGVRGFLAYSHQQQQKLAHPEPELAHPEPRQGKVFMGQNMEAILCQLGTRETLTAAENIINEHSSLLPPDEQEEKLKKLQLLLSDTLNLSAQAQAWLNPRRKAALSYPFLLTPLTTYWLTTYRGPAAKYTHVVLSLIIRNLFIAPLRLLLTSEISTQQDFGSFIMALARKLQDRRARKYTETKEQCHSTSQQKKTLDANIRDLNPGLGEEINKQQEIIKKQEELETLETKKRKINQELSEMKKTLEDERERNLGEEIVNDTKPGTETKESDEIIQLFKEIGNCQEKLKGLASSTKLQEDLANSIKLQEISKNEDNEGLGQFIKGDPYCLHYKISTWDYIFENEQQKIKNLKKTIGLKEHLEENIKKLKKKLKDLQLENARPRDEEGKRKQQILEEEFFEKKETLQPEEAQTEEEIYKKKEEIRGIQEETLAQRKKAEKEKNEKEQTSEELFRNISQLKKEIDELGIEEEKESCTGIFKRKARETNLKDLLKPLIKRYSHNAGFFLDKVNIKPTAHEQAVTFTIFIIASTLTVPTLIGAINSAIQETQGHIKEKEINELSYMLTFALSPIISIAFFIDLCSHPISDKKDYPKTNTTFSYLWFIISTSLTIAVISKNHSRLPGASIFYAFMFLVFSLLALHGRQYRPDPKPSQYAKASTVAKAFDIIEKTTSSTLRLVEMQVATLVAAHYLPIIAALSGVSEAGKEIPFLFVLPVLMLDALSVALKTTRKLPTWLQPLKKATEAKGLLLDPVFAFSCLFTAGIEVLSPGLGNSSSSSWEKASDFIELLILILLIKCILMNGENHKRRADLERFLEQICARGNPSKVIADAEKFVSELTAGQPGVSRSTSRSSSKNPPRSGMNEPLLGSMMGR